MYHVLEDNLGVNMIYHNSENCNAKTIKTKCLYCGNTVFYFSCDCGCKIFFNRLGGSWERHFCEEYIEHAIKNQEPEGNFELKDNLAKQIKEDYSNISIDIEELNNTKVSTRMPEIINIQDVGYINNIRPKFDLFKMYKQDVSEFNVDSLKGLNHRNLSFIAIHIESVLRSYIEEYLGIIESNKLDSLSIGDHVEFSIKGKSVFHNTVIWVVDEIYRI